MPTGNLLDILLEHDKWATRQMLLACEKLSADQFARAFEMGPGSLQATIAHIIGAMRRWTDTLAERPRRPRVDESGIRYSPAQLLELLDESAGEFIAIAKKHPVEQIVKWTRDGQEYCFTRGSVVTQVTTHGMHHRAQCLNMLRHLGVSPLPPSSVVEWARSVDYAQ
jgi:uncharacterized damage-inducible protein DinB